jgi:hypothetical protein
MRNSHFLLFVLSLIFIASFGVRHGIPDEILNNNLIPEDSQLPEQDLILSDSDIMAETIAEYGDLIQDLEPLKFEEISMLDYCCSVDTFSEVYSTLDGYEEVVKPWHELGLVSYISEITVFWVHDFFPYQIDVTYTAPLTGQSVTVKARAGDKLHLRTSKSGNLRSGTLGLFEGEYITNFTIHGFGILNYLRFETSRGYVMEAGTILDIFVGETQIPKDSVLLALAVKAGPEEYLQSMAAYYIPDDHPTILELVEVPKPDYFDYISYPEEAPLLEGIQLSILCMGPPYYEGANYIVQDDYVDVIYNWLRQGLTTAIKEIHVHYVIEQFIFEFNVLYENSLGETYLAEHIASDPEEERRATEIVSLYFEEGEYIIAFTAEIKGVLQRFSLTTNLGQEISIGEEDDLLRVCRLLDERVNRKLLAFQLEAGPEEWLHGIAVYHLDR